MALDVAEGDALAGLVGEVKDVAGNQLEGLDSRARRGRLKPTWSKSRFAVGKCKTD